MGLVSLASPTFKLRKDEDEGRYWLIFEQAGFEVDVALSPTDFVALIKQGHKLTQSQAVTLTSAEQEAAFRQPAMVLRHLDDRSLQVFLREMQSETLVTLLWYLKDLAIAKAVTRNLSDRAAAMLVEDLIDRYRGIDPDNALAALAAKGRESVAEAMAILARLAEDGQILLYRDPR